MGEFDSILADMGVDAPQKRKPTTEEMQEIFSGVQRTPAQTKPQLEINTELGKVEQPAIAVPELSIRDEYDARKTRMKESREESLVKKKEEAAISRDLERTGVPQSPSFAQEFGKNLVDSPVMRGITAIPRAIWDAPSDIQEEGIKLGKELEESGVNIANAIEDATFPWEEGETNLAPVAKETLSQGFNVFSSMLGTVFSTALKMATPEDIEQTTKDLLTVTKDPMTGMSLWEALSQIKDPVTKKKLGEAVDEFPKIWADFEKENPEKARNYRLGKNAAQFALDVLTFGAGKSAAKPIVTTLEKEAKTGVKVFGEAIEAAPKLEIPKVELPSFKTGEKIVDEAVTSATKVADHLGPKLLEKPSISGQIVQRIHRVLPAQAEKFAERSGKPLGEWLVERGIVDTPEKTMTKLFDRFKKSKGAVDEAFTKIKGSFKDPVLVKAGDELLALERQIAKAGVASKDKKLVEFLVNKLNNEGLSMPEINTLKRLYSRKVKTEYIKDATKTSVEVQAKTNVESAIRDFQATTARTLGFEDLSKLNMETSLSKQALDIIGEKYLRSMSNNAVSLTDYVLATGTSMNPAFLGTLVGKKILSSETVQAFIARSLARNKTKIALPTADTAKIVRKARIAEQRATFQTKSATQPNITPKVKIRKKPFVKIVQKKTPVVKAKTAIEVTPPPVVVPKAPAPKIYTSTPRPKVSSETNYNAIAEAMTKNTEGFTLKIDGSPVEKGFAFSPYKAREMKIPKSKLTGETLKKFYLKNKDLLQKDGHYLGGWLNKEDGKYYLDVSRVDKTQKAAIIKAKENDQIAIFDLGKGKEKFTKDFDQLGNRKKAGTNDRLGLGSNGTTNKGPVKIVSKKKVTNKIVPKKTGSSHLPGSTGISDKDVIKQVLTPNKQGTAIIDADAIKSILGSTPSNAPLFHAESSRLAQESFAEGIKNVKGKFIDLTAGGSGSGKTEVLINGKNGINGTAELILDGTGANYKKLLKNIDQVIEAGKTPRLNMVYADKDQAWSFVSARGRNVPKGVFESKHKDFRSSVLKAMQNREEIVPEISINSLKTGMAGERLKFNTREGAIDFMIEMEKHGTLPTEYL